MASIVAYSGILIWDVEVYKVRQIVILSKLRIKGVGMMLDWNSVVSVVTASVAVLALVLTLLQMRLSNRQNIFSKRLDV